MKKLEDGTLAIKCGRIISMVCLHPPSVMSRPVVQKTTRVSLASPNRPPGAHGTTGHVAMQMPVSTSHPNKQISIPWSVLQLPGQDEQVASKSPVPSAQPGLLL